MRKGEGEGCVQKEIKLDKIKGVPISNGPREKRLRIPNNCTLSR